MRKKIEASKAPTAIGPYSQGMATQGLVYTSGQLPIDAATGEMPADVAEQTRKSLENCRAVLEAAGAPMDHVFKTTVFITNMDDFGKINEEYGKYFQDPFPARSCVQVARLPKDAQVEIECIAYLD